MNRQYVVRFIHSLNDSETNWNQGTSTCTRAYSLWLITLHQKNNVSLSITACVCVSVFVFLCVCACPSSSASQPCPVTVLGTNWRIYHLTNTSLSCLARTWRPRCRIDKFLELQILPYVWPCVNAPAGSPRQKNCQTQSLCESDRTAPVWDQCLRELTHWVDMTPLNPCDVKNTWYVNVLW